LILTHMIYYLYNIVFYIIWINKFYTYKYLFKLVKPY